MGGNMTDTQDLHTIGYLLLLFLSSIDRLSQEGKRIRIIIYSSLYNWLSSVSCKFLSSVSSNTRGVLLLTFLLQYDSFTTCSWFFLYAVSLIRFCYRKSKPVRLVHYFTKLIISTWPRWRRISTSRHYRHHHRTKIDSTHPTSPNSPTDPSLRNCPPQLSRILQLRMSHLQNALTMPSRPRA